MSATIRTIDRTEWQRLARSFGDYNYRQLWDFGTACAGRVNAVSEHVVIEEDEEAIGLADVRIKRVPLVGGGIAYINGGPLVRRNGERAGSRLRECLNVLIEEYVHSQGLLLRIQPAIGCESWNAERASMFLDCGFSISTRVRPYRTLLLDLSPSLADLRKNLSQKWRNNLKRAEAGTNSLGSDYSVESLMRFYDLYKAFRKKKQFDVDLDPAFFVEVQKSLPESERMRVALCEEEGALISGHVSSLLGDTAVNLFRANTKAALTSRVSYLIQWDGIRYARKKGFRWYDLG
ncbi:MAG: hypothetical protein DRP66_04000, partial [Planctomycetota bacterium]